MRKRAIPISQSIEKLEMNLSTIARVQEWAELMGYNSPKKFSRAFLNHYEIRPQKILYFIRLRSIHRALRNNSVSNFKIARNHSLPDEKALNKFTNYHLNCSPSRLRTLSREKVIEKMGILDSKFR